MVYYLYKYERLYAMTTMEKIERGLHLRKLWTNNYAGSFETFCINNGLKKYPYEIAPYLHGWDSNISMAAQMLSELENFIGGMESDDKELMSVCDLHRRVKRYLDTAKTKWFIASGHSIRMKKVELIGDWKIAQHLARWQYICGSIDTEEIPFRGSESVEYYDSEEDLIRGVLPNVTEISQSSVTVCIPDEEKGKFIGRGGWQIKMYQTILGRRIIVK